MRGTFFVCKAIYLLFFTGTFFYADAQQCDIHYYMAEGLQFNNPVIAGKMQQTTLVIDRPDSLRTLAYFFDSSYHLIKQEQLPAVAYDAPLFSNDNGIHLLWQERVNDSIRFNLIRIAADGRVMPFQKMIPAEGKRGAYQQVVADRQSRFFFFYSLLKNQQSIFLKGILFDQQLSVLKKIDRAFAYDEDLQRLCSPLVDAKGNIHFLLYDKLTNYRLSANTELYTIPSDGDDAVVESFQFEKKKFYDVILYDPPGGSSIRMAGFYYDGSTKIKQGLACISFPYERGNEISQKFFPLSKGQRDFIQKDMEHVRRKNDLMDFLKLKDIYEENGKVFFTTWLMDLPNQMFYKDNEREELQNREVMTWVRGSYPGSAGRGSFYTTTTRTAVTRLVGVTQMNDVATQQANGNLFLSITDIPVNNLPRMQAAGMNRAGSFTSLYGAAFRPQKIGIFSIPETADTMWFRMLPWNYHIATVAYEASLWNYPLAVDKTLQFVHFHQQDEFAADGLIKNDTAYNRKPMLVSVGEQYARASLLPQLVVDDNIFFFSKPYRISGGRYLTAFKGRGEGNNGIALLNFVTRE